jgi:flagellar biosynthesis protein FlhG
MPMIDQANSLRRKVVSATQETETTVKKHTRVIAVTSGKGGVGKSNFSLNFALSLIQQNKKVLIFDVDLGLANIEVLLGFTPKETIVSMLEKDLSVWDVMQEGPNGLLFISGGNGFTSLFDMNDEVITRFLSKLSELHGHVDYIILDTGAGLSQENIRFILAADDVMLVTTPEPTAITDAYAVIKMIAAKDEGVDFKLIINRCVDEAEGQATADNLKMVSEKFLNKKYDLLGTVLNDDSVSKAVKMQVPFVLEYPQSVATQSINKITHQYLNLPFTYKVGIKGFLMKMLFKR